VANAAPSTSPSPAPDHLGHRRRRRPAVVLRRAERLQQHRAPPTTAAPPPPTSTRPGTATRPALSAAGINPGSTVTANGMSFTWPAAAAGKPTTGWSTGQVIDLAALGQPDLLPRLRQQRPRPPAVATVTYTDAAPRRVDHMTDWAVGTPQSATPSPPRWPTGTPPTAPPCGPICSPPHPWHSPWVSRCAVSHCRVDQPGAMHLFAISAT